MNNKDMLSFIRTLPVVVDQKVVKTFTSINQTVTEIYNLEEKEFKKDKKDWDKEKREAKKKERDKKRREADKGRKPGLLSQIIGKTDSEKKKAGNDLTNLLLAGGLLVGGGALAWNYREEIGDYVENTLKPLIEEKIKEGVDFLKEEIGKWAQDMADQAKQQIKDKVLAPAGDAAGRPVFENVQEPLQRMAAGYGVTKGGTIFTLSDLTTYKDQITSHNGYYPDELKGPTNEVQRRLKIDKSINDDLWRKQERINALEGRNNTQVPSRPTRANELQELKDEVEVLQQNRKQNRAFMANEWAKLGLADRDLQRTQRRQGRRDDQGYIFRQTGGTVTADDAAAKGKPSGKELDERLFSTTAYELGAQRPTKEQRYQTGGLVLFQGHGDVPSNSGIAPGTDGPGTDYQGKYKPTAEQHFVNEVLKRTALLASKENVPVSYQRSTGKYLSASHPQSNWSLANGIRRKGGSAIEVHFDAYGMQNGRMIEGARGILKGGQGVLTKIEKSVESKFGVHPSSGQGWGTLMLELDSLKHARTRIDQYPRMLVDAVKNAGAKGAAPATTPAGTNVTPGGTSSGTTTVGSTNSTTPTTGPGPLQTLNTGIGDFAKNIFPGVGAFFEGFKSGFSKTFKNPFAKTKVETHQVGGIVGGKGSKLSARFSAANGAHNAGMGNVVARPVVVVKRSAPVIPPAPDASPAMTGASGGGLNMVEASQALHRIQSGSKY